MDIFCTYFKVIINVSNDFLVVPGFTKVFGQFVIRSGHHDSKRNLEFRKD